MSAPVVIEYGGYNQEARQDASTSAGYIYSSSGNDVVTYMNTIYPYLPAYISFGSAPSADDLTIGLPGQNSIPSKTTIYPYEGDAEATLPRTLTIKAGSTELAFMLIAKVVSLTLVESANPDSSDTEPTKLNGLATMPLPKGYTYESSILSEDLVLTCLDVATILIYSSFNFQRYA